MLLLLYGGLFAMFLRLETIWGDLRSHAEWRNDSWHRCFCVEVEEEQIIRVISLQLTFHFFHLAFIHKVDHQIVRTAFIQAAFTTWCAKPAAKISCSTCCTWKPSAKMNSEMLLHKCFEAFLTCTTSDWFIEKLGVLCSILLIHFDFFRCKQQQTRTWIIESHETPTSVTLDQILKVLTVCCVCNILAVGWLYGTMGDLTPPPSICWRGLKSDEHSLVHPKFHSLMHPCTNDHHDHHHHHHDLINSTTITINISIIFNIIIVLSAVSDVYCWLQFGNMSKSNWTYLCMLFGIEKSCNNGRPQWHDNTVQIWKCSACVCASVCVCARQQERWWGCLCVQRNINVIVPPNPTPPHSERWWKCNARIQQERWWGRASEGFFSTGCASEWNFGCAGECVAIEMKSPTRHFSCLDLSVCTYLATFPQI